MRVMISCGEASGDLYAGALAAQLVAREPTVEMTGLGGDRLQAAGARLVAHYQGIAVTGLTEAIRVLPEARRVLNRLVEEATRHRPDVFVAVDFPDFNFRLMARLARLGIPVVYYVSPQLWAWRASRMRTMQRYVTEVLVIFPFEEAIYREAGVPVRFVGHPLVDLSMTAVAGHDRREFLTTLGLNPEAPTVALLPGSRPNEVARHVPVVSASLERIAARVPTVQFVVARAPGLIDWSFMPLREAARACERPLVTVAGQADAVLASADVALAASGTATVQCAIHGRPMVAIYRLSPVSYALLRPFVKVDTAAMPNLIAGTRIVPELLQGDCTPSRVAHEVVALLGDEERQAAMRHALEGVRDRLHVPGASARAAEAVLKVVARV
jgi:lipid-A-disaccharide synthase